MASDSKLSFVWVYELKHAQEHDQNAMMMFLDSKIESSLKLHFAFLSLPEVIFLIAGIACLHFILISIHVAVFMN